MAGPVDREPAEWLHDLSGGQREAAQALIWADGGYAGQFVTWAKRLLKVTVEIVRKPTGIRTFQVLPRRWVVERTFAWIVRCRRLDHDYDRLPEHPKQ